MQNSGAAKARIRKLIGLVVGLGLFGLVIYQLGPEQVLAALKGLNGCYLLVACGMFALSYAIKVGKWHFMQQRADLNRSLLSTAHLYFSTRVGGLVTPMRSGEFIPGLLDEEKGQVLAITFFDRIIESIQTLLTFLVVFALFAYQFISPSGLWPLLLFALVLVLLCLPFLFPRRSAQWILRLLDWIGEKGRLRRVRWIVKLEVQARGVVKQFFDIAARFFSPATIVLLLAVTFVGWFFDILVSFNVFRAVGVFLNITVVMTSVMTMSMVNFIAPTPSGLGIGDSSLALILGPLGFQGEIGAFLIIARILTASLTILGHLFFGSLDR